MKKILAPVAAAPEARERVYGLAREDPLSPITIKDPLNRLPKQYPAARYSSSRELFKA